MGMSSMENGLKIRPTATVYITMSMGQSMKAIGKMIYSMDSAKKFGLMGPNMRGTITTAKNKGKVIFF